MLLVRLGFQEVPCRVKAAALLAALVEFGFRRTLPAAEIRGCQLGLFITISLKCHPLSLFTNAAFPGIVS